MLYNIGFFFVGSVYLLPSTLPWYLQVISFNIPTVLYVLVDARAHEYRKVKVDTFVCVEGIPLKLAIILPACTFYGIYVYQRDRSLRLTFLERLTTQSLLAHLSSTNTSGSDSLILVNVASNQVEYLNSQARELFLASDDAQAAIVKAETGTVRGEYSRRIVERLASAFFEVDKVSEKEA